MIREIAAISSYYFFSFLANGSRDVETTLVVRLALRDAILTDE